MPFIIRTTDDQVSICTPSAEEAAKHIRRLQDEGAQVIVSGPNGEQVQIDGLDDLARAHDPGPILSGSSKP